MENSTRGPRRSLNSEPNDVVNYVGAARGGPPCRPPLLAPNSASSVFSGVLRERVLDPGCPGSEVAALMDVSRSRMALLVDQVSRNATRSTSAAGTTTSAHHGRSQQHGGVLVYSDNDGGPPHRDVVDAIVAPTVRSSSKKYSEYQFLLYLHPPSPLPPLPPLPPSLPPRKKLIFWVYFLLQISTTWLSWMCCEIVVGTGAPPYCSVEAPSWTILQSDCRSWSADRKFANSCCGCFRT